jgi:hypothetical protein
MAGAAAEMTKRSRRGSRAVPARAKDDGEQRKAILESLAALDLSALRRLASLVSGGADNPADSGSGYLRYLKQVAESDVAGLKTSEKSYGNSWKRRGGVDTFNMLTRKWDRIEKSNASAAARGASRAEPYDIFEHLAADARADGLIDDVRDLRRYLYLVEAEIAVRNAGKLADSGRKYLGRLAALAKRDVDRIRQKEKSYGNSWKRRGGISAFMMLARKWDRIEQRITRRIEPAAGAPGASRDNIFEHIAADRRAEGVLDDIGDLRRFLLLLEAEMAARGKVKIGTARDNRVGV